MMMLRKLVPLPIDIEHIDEHFAAVEQRFERPPAREALAQCREPLLAGVSDNFTRSQSPRGTPWPERKDNKPHPLLNLSGDLLAAATQTGAPGHVDHLDETSLTIGVDKGVIPYAGVHQFGYPEKNIPQREYLGANKQTIQECGAIIGRELLPDLFFV